MRRFGIAHYNFIICLFFAWCAGHWPKEEWDYSSRDVVLRPDIVASSEGVMMRLVLVAVGVYALYVREGLYEKFLGVFPLDAKHCPVNGRPEAE